MRGVRTPVEEEPAEPETEHGAPAIPARYLRALLLRGAAVWLIARLMVMALYMSIAASAPGGTAAAFTNGNALLLSGWTLVLTAALMHLDLHRRHEATLLNNLGVITSRAVILGTVPAVVMETAMTILT